MTEADKSALRIFLSTPSARRATVGLSRNFMWMIISIHALREEGDLQAMADPDKIAISIHALREEGDFAALVYHGKKEISIHALREEGDCYHSMVFVDIL